jgi:hypothetical protein
MTTKRTIAKIGVVGKTIKRLVSALRGLEQCSAHLSTEVKQQTYEDIRKDLAVSSEWLMWAMKSLEYLEGADYDVKQPKEPAASLF